MYPERGGPIERQRISAKYAGFICCAPAREAGWRAAVVTAMVRQKPARRRAAPRVSEVLLAGMAAPCGSGDGVGAVCRSRHWLTTHPEYLLGEERGAVSFVTTAGSIVVVGVSSSGSELSGVVAGQPPSRGTVEMG